LAWWRERLAGAPPGLGLPLDRPRPPVQTFRGGSLRLALRPEAARRVRELGRRLEATPFMVLLAAWAALLARSTRETDVVVGTAVAGRDRPELEPLIGLFAGNLPLRLDLAGDPPFAEVAARARETVLSAWAHREVPFERLVRELALERDLSRSPLYQTVLTLDASDRPPLALPGLRLEMLPVESGTAKFDLGLYLEDRRGEVAGLLEYNRDLFDRTTAARLLAAFERLVEAVPDGPERRVSELPLLSPAERHQVLVELPATPGAPEPPLVPRLVAAQVAARPAATAVTGGGGSLSYGDLDRRAEGLARRLRALGVGPEVRVAVCLDRSRHLVVAMLGIWKAGGVYVPLDPAHPDERLAWMVADSGAVAVLAERRGPVPPAGAPALFLDDAADGSAPAAPLSPDGATSSAIAPESAAYVVYTSGSTGRPKGVVVTHGSLAAYAAAAAGLYGVGPGDRVLQSASPGFDLSLDEIVPCLAAGAELALRDDAMLASPAAFLDGCRRRGVTVLSLPTALWHDIAARTETEDLPLPPSLRLVILGGEALLPERLAAWQRRFPGGPQLLNTYGPTEATIVVTGVDVSAPADAPRRAAPIGRPLPGAAVWLLGRSGEPVPPGAAGEIVIGGPFLARGYLGQPDRTAERFVPHPFPPAPGARLYRTGDLARLLPDGTLEFVGRLDEQVKVRGHRVEPGEVEAALAKHPAVEAAAVATRDDAGGGKRLVAYVVPRPPTPAAAALRDFLAASLPEPLVPSDFVFLEALPRTPNGKVDRRALPAPAARVADAEPVAPRDEMERAVAALWREALGVERVGVHDNFFDLGGHSLALARVHVLLKERLGREVPVVDLFRHPTVAALARRLALPAEEAGAAPPAPDVRKRAERSRAAAREGRFLAARKRLAAAPPQARAVPPPPLPPPGSAAPESAHARLSRASVAFLRFAEADPECLERASFAPLADHAAGSPYPLQPWPALVDSGRVAEMERVSAGLVRLVKSLPRRVFGDDPERLRDFYGLASADLARSLVAEPSGLDAAIGRGDFLEAAGGLQCLELNLVSDLGGWQAPLWAEGYARVPVFRRFLRAERLRVTCRDTVALLFAHVAAEARELGAADGEVNGALVLPEAAPPLPRELEPWLAARWTAALRGAAPGAGGRLALLPYSALRERDGRLWADGRPLHAAVEIHHDGTAAQAFRCFKAGRLKLFNAPVRTILTDKRNLALLSELADRGDLLEPGERELVTGHVPWTRRLVPAAVSWRGCEAWVPELVLAHREELVIKRAREGRGAAVHLGAATPEPAWREAVERALAQGDWVVQERVEPLPFLHQHGERGSAPHDVVWGLFVFGDRYGGGFLSLVPRSARADPSGEVVNLTRGASAGVIFEVQDDA
ncbi:MAG TPA: amino acid adenylation domain-containing protein, partial [Thermoanaerobaculia bacterium]|nr:amino acid adenylation domain-containing protein [Thermoanaerobaculia bacterium]